MGHPSEVKHIVLDGNSLTLETFVAVARFGAEVSVAEEAYGRMQRSRELAEKIADEGRVAYGITTGFGDFQKVAVPEEMSNQLSTNLILSHCTATGEPYADEVVRGIMLLRANDPGGDGQQKCAARDPAEGFPGFLRRPGAPCAHDPAHAGAGRGKVPGRGAARR